MPVHDEYFKIADKQVNFYQKNT